MTESSTLRRSLPVIGVVALIVVVAFLSWQVAHKLLLAFFGVLLAVLFASLGGALARRTGMPHRAGVGIVLVALLAFLVGVGFLIGPSLSDQLDQLGGEVSGAVASMREMVRELPGGQWALERLPELPVPGGGEGGGADGGEGSPAPQAGQEGGEAAAAGAGGGAEGGAAAPAGQEGGPAEALPTGNLAGAVASTLRGIVAAFADGFFVLILAIFLALDPRLYREGLVRLFPIDRRDGVRNTLDATADTLRGWLFGQGVAMLTIGVLAGVGLALLGVPLALALGFLAFLFEFIPTVGPWLAGVPAVLVALTQSPTTALWVIVLFVAIELAEGNLIYPIIQKKAADLPLALTIFSIFVMGALFGFVGVLVAAPLAATVLTVVRVAYVEGTLEAGTADEPAARDASPERGAPSGA